jgi:16S rRNA processing protein RimM
VAEQDETQWATIGKVVAPFGVRGELKVLSMSDIPGRFAALTTVHLGPDHILRPIQGVRPYKGEMLLLKVAGVEDANSAESLRNYELTIPLSQLAQLPADSYYQHDIVGLRVLTMTGREIGRVEDIMVTGSNDVYIIQSPAGKQLLVPAIKDVIKQIDLIRQMMYIDPISGLLDDDETGISQGEE